MILYIAPTKALVNDLEKRLSFLLNQLNIRVGVRHGDRDDLLFAKTPHVLITTPESLEVLLFRHESKILNIRALVIDEVHLLYNTQRGLQLSILIQRLKKLTNQQIQWAALSATVTKLSNVRDFLFGSYEQADFIELSTHRPIDAHIRKIIDEDSFLELIFRLTSNQSRKLLLFANSRKQCEELAGILKRNKFLNPYIFTHYSSLSTEVRIETENKFFASKTAICISTSTLELGIDIGDIDAVILWGVPGGVESFLQRIGRSNRRQNITNVICLIPYDSEDNVVFESLKFITLIANAKQGIIPMKMSYQLFGAIAQQCLSIIGSINGKFTRISDLYDLIKSHNYLDRLTLEKILAQLEEKEYLKKHGFKNQYGGNENLYKLIDYKMIYGNFAASSKSIEIRYSKKVLGEIPADNLTNLYNGVLINFAGNTWKVCKMSSNYIVVEQAKTKGSVVNLKYSGGKIKLDPFLFNSMWKIICEYDSYSELLHSSLLDTVESYINQFRQKCTFSTIPYIRKSNQFSYFTFAGSLINKAIVNIIGHTQASFDDITITTYKMIDWNSIPTNPQEYESIFSLLVDRDAKLSIYQELLPVELQSQEALQNWLKDQVVFDVLKRLSCLPSLILTSEFIFRLSDGQIKTSPFLVDKEFINRYHRKV
jgi:ATP-dependent Lhr-like helicase